MKIAIAGYGVEGRANYTYFRDQGHEVTIADEGQLSAMDLPYGVSSILGKGAFQELDGFDMVVRTAGLDPSKIRTTGKIWSGTNEFFEKCPAPIIGVTGSKGKGTTCCFVASILRAAGHTVHLVGNIGLPAISTLGDIRPEDIVVYELSSFQLWDAQRSPRVAVVLGIEPEHLDVHKDFNDYLNAKANITVHQIADDTLVYNRNNDNACSIANKSIACKIPYQDEAYAHVKDGYFWYGTIQICKTDVLQIPGIHNLDNACAAIAATRGWVDDAAITAKGLHMFLGLPHRLKFVRTVNNVNYYDDSIATTPGSAIAALNAFDQTKILILGGSDKGADYRELAEEVAKHDVRDVVLIGAEASKIEKALKKAKYRHSTNLGSAVSMADVVRTCAERAMPGDIVVLSPSCASFGMFKNYSDRGDQFIAAVNAL